MHVLRSMAIAFSMYSKIPVPNFEWDKKDLRYMLCFFPLVGVVIGACLSVWMCFCSFIGIGAIFRTAVGCVIPVIITGGIHADGFIDVCDALSSHKSREEKLVILKDSHIGAFAVILFVVYAALFAGGMSEIKDMTVIFVASLGFVLSRGLSALAAMCFKAAKSDGTLFTFTEAADRKKTFAIVLCESLGITVCMILINPIYGAFASASAYLTYLYYFYRSRKEFGGVTGDTAGYFLCLCECVMILALAVISHFF